VDGALVFNCSTDLMQTNTSRIVGFRQCWLEFQNMPEENGLFIRSLLGLCLHEVTDGGLWYPNLCCKLPDAEVILKINSLHCLFEVITVLLVHLPFLLLAFPSPNRMEAFQD
jgi:hypothetical protein